MTKIEGGRRTRRVNAWAKAAGEYYRSHKNDSDIQAFSDVLKSPKFKAYYDSKYKKREPKGRRFSKRRRSQKSYKQEMEHREEKEDHDEMEHREEKEDHDEMEHRDEKPKNQKTKTKKTNDDWSWGFNNREQKKMPKKNSYFNGGNKPMYTK